MTMPLSGVISMKDANVELISTLTNDTEFSQRSLNDSKVRTLFNRPSGEISMFHGYGKSRIRTRITSNVVVTQYGLLADRWYANRGRSGIGGLLNVNALGYYDFEIMCGGVNGNARWDFPKLGNEPADHLGLPRWGQGRDGTSEIYSISATQTEAFDDGTTSSNIILPSSVSTGVYPTATRLYFGNWNLLQPGGKFPNDAGHAKAISTPGDIPEYASYGIQRCQIVQSYMIQYQTYIKSKVSSGSTITYA